MIGFWAFSDNVTNCSWLQNYEMAKGSQTGWGLVCGFDTKALITRPPRRN